MDNNMNIESTTSQKKKILAILRTGRKVSNKELINANCGVDVRKRISELRDEGHDIRDEINWAINENRHKVRFKKYWLVEEDDDDTMPMIGGMVQ